MRSRGYRFGYNFQGAIDGLAAITLQIRAERCNGTAGVVLPLIPASLWMEARPKATAWADLCPMPWLVQESEVCRATNECIHGLTIATCSL